MKTHLFRMGPAALLVAALALMPSAEAAPRGPESGRVTAFSHYGNGSVSGPTRKTWWGHEVQSPKGSWLDCKGDCREELRKWALDFWETRNEDAPDHGRQ